MLNLSVDIRHWLDEAGDPAEAVRRKALWIARMIEYGGSLEPGFARETLIECTMRPKRRPCPGLLWVAKTASHHIDAWCPRCEQLNVIISGWEHTLWAEGPMEPVARGTTSRDDLSGVGTSDPSVRWSDEFSDRVTRLP